MRGPLFFGAAGFVSSVLDNIGERPVGFVLDLSRVPFIDGTAAHAIVGFFEKARRRGVRVAIAGVQDPVLRVLEDNGLEGFDVALTPDLDSARELLSKPSGAAAQAAVPDRS